MLKHAKRILTAASALLVIGAGCGQPAVKSSAETEMQADLNAGAQAGDEKEGAMQKSEVDAAVDVYLEGAAVDDASATEEDKDASTLNSADAEINAYGQVYDKSEF